MSCRGPSTRKRLPYCNPTEVCTDEDLQKLDSDEMQPKPVEMNHLRELERRMHDTYNEKVTVCAVCDQFCRFPSDGKYFRPVEVPSEFFELLQTPDGTGENFEKPLHPQLIAQYDVSTKVPEWTQFRGVLLSQQGVGKVECCETPGNCSHPYKIFICQKYGCFPSLNRGSVPKFSIRNGNYIGRLPKEVRIQII